MSEASSKQRRKKWDPNAMIRAISAIRNKEMGYFLASIHFKVLKSILEDYVKNSIKSADKLVSTNLSQQPALSKLVKWI